MKAMVIHKFGGPEVFEKAEVAMPELKPGYVLVKVHASSVNPLETRIRAGLAPAFTPPFPAILNGDFSGEIVSVGADVKDWKAGDQVFGCAGGIGQLQGALAEYMLADADLIAPKPINIDHETTALFPLVSITAWEGIMENPYLRPDDKVLIHGAAGGVGHIASQLAKLQGAVVYGVVKSEKQAATAKKYGVDFTILVDEEPVQDYVKKYTDGKGFDMVFDTLGGNNLAKSFEAAKLKGFISTTAARVTLDLGPMYLKALTLRAQLMAAPMFYNVDRKRQGNIMKNLSKLIEEGKMRINRDERQFNFTDIGMAHQYFEAHQASGKISLRNDL